MKKRTVRIFITFLVVASILTIAYMCKPVKPDYSGITLKIYSSIDLAGGSYLEGAKKFEKDFGCKVEFTDNFEDCDLFYSSGEDFSRCMPLNKYIDLNNKLYTRSIIDQCCTVDGNIYGITNALVGRINYCTYNPDQFGDAKTPYEYYKTADWTWNNFLTMAADIDSNVAIDWNSSYINMMHSLFLDENGTPSFDYGTQKQVEWLNFIRSMIYDRGIDGTAEGVYEVGFLPQLILDNSGNKTKMRYIPWPTKNGHTADVFVDEYHFCVPKGAKNPEISVELANYIIESCIETRSSLYKENMTKEDYKIFQKQLEMVYCYPKHSDYVPAQKFIDDFTRGKTVSEHIYNVKEDAEHIE